MQRFVCALSVALVLSATRLFAVAPVYTNNFLAVTLDGVRLGTDLDASNLSLFPSVVYDSGTGVYHMWVIAGATQTVEDIKHATSTDGVHFVSTGYLSFLGGNPFPIYGAPTEPPLVFPRAAKLSSDWKLLLWTHNDPSGATGDYNYNESVNDIGADPATLVVAHQGPVYPTNGTGTFGQTTGPFGMVGGKLYVADDRPGGISKWDYNDTTPPSVDPPADHDQDLITGTGYVYFLTNPGNPLAVYVHNIGRVLDQGDGTLGVYYSLRYPDGSRVNKQIYYAQSGDDGQSWSTPVGIFSNGDAVRVDGAPNQFEFSHPEVTLVGARRILYFSTKAADGQFVVATSAGQPPSPGSWSGIYGSGQGAGESGRAVIRTAGGGYAIAGDSDGFVNGGNGAFWLLKLDGTGDVEWQKAYAYAGGPFHVRALAEAADGGLVMAGSVGNGCSVAWVLKVDILGNLVWSNTYATNDVGLGGCANAAYGIVRTSDDGFAFAGSVAGYFGLTKVDAGGTLQWIRAYGGGSTLADSHATSIVQTPDGGYALAGTWISAGGSSAYRVLKTDSSGAIAWEETFGGTLNDFASGIANGAGGGLVVTGGSQTVGGMWTIRLDDAGNVAWQKTYKIAGAEAAGGIVPSATGGYAIAGAQGTPSRATLLELDASGAPSWGKSFATVQASASAFHALVPTFDGGFLAAGEDKPGADSRLLAIKVDAGGGFVGCLDEEYSLTFTSTTTSVTPASLSDSAVDEGANTTVAARATVPAVTDAPERVVCAGTLPDALSAAALAVDAAASGASDANGVADPGEKFITAPSWTNFGLAATFLSGHASEKSDSNGLATTDPDLDAHYGTIAAGATADCQDTTGDCYMFHFQNIPRPSQHWDTYFDETLTTSDPHHRYAYRWTVHAGLSFDDVLPSNMFYRFIENIFHNGVTSGCSLTGYCPDAAIPREQMAVFLLRSRFGSSYVPPPAVGLFDDVPVSSPYARWIEDLANRQDTSGCSVVPPLFCPDLTVSREQMSVLLLRTLIGPTYTPPPAVGLFEDVPASSGLAAWIEDLYNRGITAGCSTSPALYCPGDPNTRGQMAVFLVATFGLQLYGP